MHSGVTAMGAAVVAGDESSFITTFRDDLVRSYCAVVNFPLFASVLSLLICLITGEYRPHGSSPHSPVLAVNRDINGFSLCESKYDQAIWMVVYKPSPRHTRYSPESCYAVRLHLEGLY